MAKKVEKKIKVQVMAGKANPAPPLGPALGQAGVNIGEFVNQFNDKTKDMGGDIIPVEISVYEDRSFSFILKTPPASSLLMKAAGVKKGSGKSLVEKVGSVTKAQIREISEKKLQDLNAATLEAADRIIEGTARNMGIEVK